MGSVELRRQRGPGGGGGVVERRGVVHGRNPHTSLLLLYIPSIGMEYFKQLPLQKSQVTLANGFDVAFATIRLNVEYWPIDHADRGGFQIIANVTIRQRMGAANELPSIDTYETLQATYFFDTKNHFGIGISFNAGRDAQRNFLFDRLWQFGPRFKF